LTKEITAALCKFIQQVGTIHEKDNAQFGEFADLSTVLSVVNPALAANGLSVIHTTKILEGKNVLVTNLMHTSGEIISSEYLLPVASNVRGNPMHAEGGALTYFRRYCELAILGLNAGIPDNDGDFANPTTSKITPITKHRPVGMPTILDKETRDHYLKKVGELYLNSTDLYKQLTEAMYVEYGFDKTSGKFSDYIQEPKHVTYIQTWLDAYVND
jgi:hypothetical protein